jgi:threonine-phosphate decarboxylase
LEKLVNALTASKQPQPAAGSGQAAPQASSHGNMAGAGLHGGTVFQAARQWGCDWREILDFSASINPLGVSDRVREALANSIGRIAHYPETDSPALREAVAVAWGVEPSQVIAGNGATELLYFLVRVLRPQSAHLVLPTFSEYPKALAGCELSSTACGANRGEDDYAMDWRCLAENVALARPDWLVLTQPNNPTGGVFDPGEFLRWFDEQRPSGTTVVLDESFIDFAPQLSLAAATRRRPDLLILRSLTKFYALPGLRLGCLVGHAERVAALEGSREPWQVNVLAEQAGLAALGDDGYRRQTLELVNEEREWLRQALAQLPGLRPFPSAANFVFAACDVAVHKLQLFLRDEKILIRDCTAMAGVRGNCFRAAVRSRSENEALVEALRRFFER